MVFSVQLLFFLFIRNEELVTTRLKKEKIANTLETKRRILSIWDLVLTT